MRKDKKIAILGGSFDPPTLAHVHIAKLVKEKTDVDEVWLVPCYNHAHQKHLSDFYVRKDMLMLALSNEHKIFICTIENQLKLSGYSKDLITALRKWSSKNSYYMICGQDVANNFENFYEHEWLKENVPYIVLSRPGVPANEDLWYAKKPHLTIENDMTDECSSTLARNAIKNRNETDALKYISKEVYNYAISNKMYT
jgi:nicotinate-nucleotide adenylyltransferase